MAVIANQQTMSPNHFERACYAMLDEIGVAYEAQAIFAKKFCVDALLEDARLVIQFDGDYWHGNPTRFEALDDRQRRRRALDQSQDAYMQRCGYRVLRLWQSDFETDRAACVERVRVAVAEFRMGEAVNG